MLAIKGGQEHILRTRVHQMESLGKDIVEDKGINNCVILELMCKLSQTIIFIIIFISHTTISYGRHQCRVSCLASVGRNHKVTETLELGVVLIGVIKVGETSLKVLSPSRNHLSFLLIVDFFQPFRLLHQCAVRSVVGEFPTFSSGPLIAVETKNVFIALIIVHIILTLEFDFTSGSIFPEYNDRAACDTGADSRIFFLRGS